jgi:biopolymer transport protein ExbD
MDLFEDEPKKRSLLTLQLAPLIDIFVLIIVFLIKGTVFGGVATIAPEGLLAPKSSSKESLDVAAQVFVYQDKIIFKMIERTIAKKDFFAENSAPLKEEITKAILAYKAQLPEIIKKEESTILNFVADTATPYEEIFPIVKYIRECGYESLLFIAQGDSDAK